MVMRLAEAYVETADQIHTFISNKEHIAASHRRMKSELKKVGMYLEPMRKDVGKTMTAEQEAAALAKLQEHEEFGKYADKVEKLWKQTARTSPLSLSYIVSVIAPELKSALVEGPIELDEEPVQSSATPYVMTVVLAALLLVAAAVSLHFVKKKKQEKADKEAAEEARRRAAEAEHLRREAALAAQNQPVVEEVKEPNTYDVDDFVKIETMSQVDGSRLHEPKRMVVEGKYTLEVEIITAEGKSIVQRYELTKPLVSIGRKVGTSAGNAGSEGTADIALASLPGHYSRFAALLKYVDGKDTAGNAYHFWQLAVNQNYRLMQTKDEAGNPVKVPFYNTCCKYNKASKQPLSQDLIAVSLDRGESALVGESLILTVK